MDDRRELLIVLDGERFVLRFKGPRDLDNFITEMNGSFGTKGLVPATVVSHMGAAGDGQTMYFRASKINAYQVLS